MWHYESLHVFHIATEAWSNSLSLQSTAAITVMKGKTKPINSGALTTVWDLCPMNPLDNNDKNNIFKFY